MVQTALFDSDPTQVITAADNRHAIAVRRGDSWKLDDHTKTVGREGIAQARLILQRVPANAAA